MSGDALERYLDEFGSQLDDATRRRQVRSPRKKLRGQRRVLMFAVLVLIGLAAAALAATGLLTGEPVRSQFGEAVKPNVGTGASLPATARLFDLQVADPAGGPAWGMRIVTTTRKAGCVQVGRLLDGRLGVLGQDHAFGNDGLFHPLPPEVIDDANCQPLDQAGKLYTAMSAQGVPVSASGRDCLIGRRLRNAPPSCPPGDVRILYYGTLGPQAESVTYPDTNGKLATAATSGPEGAYLIVLPVSRHHPARGYFVPSPSPLSGLRSVRYHDGHVCHIPDPRRLGGARPCPRVGYAAPPPISINPDTLPVPVHARFSPTPDVPGDLAPGGPREKLWIVTVRFRAPVASRSLHAYYVVEEQLDAQTLPCRGIGLGSVRHDVARGEIASDFFYVSTRCRGRGHGTVYFHQPTTSGKFADQMPYSGGGTSRNTVIGRFSFRIPQRPGGG